MILLHDSSTCVDAEKIGFSSPAPWGKKTVMNVHKGHKEIRGHIWYKKINTM